MDYPTIVQYVEKFGKSKHGDGPLAHIGVIFKIRRDRGKSEYSSNYIKIDKKERKLS
jgi:hypothetical protein